MPNTIAAVGIFAESDTPSSATIPSDIGEVLATLDEIVDKYAMGDILSDEDTEIVKAYLPAIGVDETSLTEMNALVGKGSFDFDRSDTGLDVHVDGECGCHSTGEGRIEWWANMAVNKTGGDTAISSFTFDFRGASFGMGPTGKMKLIYKRDFEREFAGTESAVASFNDRYVFTQWGFYFSCACTLATNKGDVVVM